MSNGYKYKPNPEGYILLTGICCPEPDWGRVATWCRILGPHLHSRHAFTKCRNCGCENHGGGMSCDPVNEIPFYDSVSVVTTETL